MGISETKKQIVIDNYFKNTCDVNTSIKEAFTKGFEVGLTKAVFPKDQKSDIVAILDKIRAEISNFNCEYIEYGDDHCGYESYINEDDVLTIINKYKAESER